MSQLFDLLFIWAMLFLSIGLVVAPASAQQASSGGRDAELPALAGADLSGAWRLNEAESDDPLQKMQELVQAKAGAANAAAASGKQLPPLTISLFPPETLVLADGASGEMTVNETFQDIIQTRTFLPDGKTRAYEIGAGAFYKVSAFKVPAKMTVETVSPRGNRMVETYELADAGKKLKVTVRIETAEAKQLVTLRRVYDRALVDVFSGGDEVQ